MDKTSQIRLTPAQALKLVEHVYPAHYNYNIPADEREGNSDFIMNTSHTINTLELLRMLTAAIGTEYTIEVKSSTNGIGWTNIITILPIIGVTGIKGFRDESMEHIQLMQLFLNAKSYGWFKNKCLSNYQIVL